MKEVKIKEVTSSFYMEYYYNNINFRNKLHCYKYLNIFEYI
jgi:hypothetical protein